MNGNMTLLREIGLWGLRVLSAGLGCLIVWLVQDVREDVRSTKAQVGMHAVTFGRLEEKANNLDADVRELKAGLIETNRKIETMKDRLWSAQTDARRTGQ